jgi:hypothetical protein
VLSPGSVDNSGPNDAEVLQKDDSFEAVGAIDVNYTITFGEVELWDVCIDHRTTRMIQSRSL